MHPLQQVKEINSTGGGWDTQVIGKLAPLLSICAHKMQMIGHQQVTPIGMSAFGLHGYALLWLCLILISIFLRSSCPHCFIIHSDHVCLPL
jgi:hypothetical protein